MQTNGHISLAHLRWLERTAASVARLDPLDTKIRGALDALSLPKEKLRGRRIAVTVGSRGISSVREIARALCGWLKDQGAQPFVIPAMGSHGGATAEGQLKVLEGYGVTPDYIGAEIRSSMEAVCLGETPEGFKAFMDRNAWESDGVLVMNFASRRWWISDRLAGMVRQVFGREPLAYNAGKVQLLAMRQPH